MSSFAGEFIKGNPSVNGKGGGRCKVRKKHSLAKSNPFVVLTRRARKRTWKVKVQHSVTLLEKSKNRCVNFAEEFRMENSLVNSKRGGHH